MVSKRFLCGYRRVLTAISENNAALRKLTLVVDDLAARYSQDNKQDQIERNGRVIVEVKCTFLKIGDINTVIQEFEAEIFIQSKWEEPALDNISESEIRLFDHKQYWDPKLAIMNISGDLDVNKKSYSIRLDEPGYEHALILQHWRFKGRFQESLELEHFPFDVQDLTIQLSSDRCTERVHIVEDEHEISTVNVNMFLDAQEWAIYQHVECIQDIATRELSRNLDHPVLQIQTRVRRKTGSYLWNVVFIMFMIKLLTFATIGILPDIPDRMMLIASLFLTAVTFKLVVSSSLPTISYLTYLDKYILLSLGFLWLQSMESATVSELTKMYAMETVLVYDAYAMGGLIILLIIFHIIFGIYIHRTALRKRRIMVKKDQLYEVMKKRRSTSKQFMNSN